MREFAYSFYSSTAWKKCRESFMLSRGYVCELCGSPGEVCHHKEHVQPWNINDVNITLNWNNLMCVCRECHGLLHSSDRFDKNGNLIPKSIEFEKNQSELTDLLELLKSPQG